jgi:hypothetical protein
MSLMNAFVVSGLVKRRAELAGEIEKAHLRFEIRAGDNGDASRMPEFLAAGLQ